MKQWLFIFFLFPLITFAQTKVGLRIAPSLQKYHIQETDENVTIDNSGNYISYVFGPFIDLFISENYFFHTGIFYNPKTFSYTINDGLSTLSPELQINHLQVPVALKLYTDEIALDQRIFFNIGGQAEVRINSPLIEDNATVGAYSFFDLAYYLGLGWEYNLSLNTRIYAGFTATGGIINQAAETDIENLNIRSRLYSLDLGVKF